MILDLFITWPLAVKSKKVLPLKGRKCNKKFKVIRKISNPVFQTILSRYRRLGENTPPLNKSLHHNNFSLSLWLSKVRGNGCLRKI